MAAASTAGLISNLKGAADDVEAGRTELVDAGAMKLKGGFELAFSGIFRVSGTIDEVTGGMLVPKLNGAELDFAGADTDDDPDEQERGPHQFQNPLR